MAFAGIPVVPAIGHEYQKTGHFTDHGKGVHRRTSGRLPLEPLPLPELWLKIEGEEKLGEAKRVKMR